eukprot:10291324-Alexandrium_andersonii.AAC.1
MSASLVGSEMCIRDRSYSSLNACHDGPGLSLSMQKCLSKSWLAGHACAPVSYTHLTLPTICSV